MDREARANLIVIIVVLALLIPGAIIVVRKKMDPTIRPMGRPDEVRSGLVYIDPTPAPASIPRMVPAITESWTRSLARGRLSGFVDARQAADKGAIMSDERMVEVVGFSRGDDGATRIGLIVWGLPRGSRDVELKVDADHAAAVESSELLTLPVHVMRDLQYSGYPAPPQLVLWAIVKTTDVPGSEISLRLSCNADTTILKDTLRLVLR